MKTITNKITRIEYIDPSVYDRENDSHYDFVPAIFHTVGFVLKEDKQTVVIAREMRNDENEERARGVLVIPKVTILKRQEVTVK